MKAVEYAEQASEIFVLSDSFFRIRELIADETSTIDDISNIILLDPGLAGIILKLSNSSFFNYPGKIDTISKAVLVLGITEVYNLVIAYFTSEAFKAIEADKEYLDRFWQQSVDCALLIKFIGNHLNIRHVERLFILGLLHNLGELVVKQFSPEKITACEFDEKTEYPWLKQQSVLGFSFGQCSAELLKLWQLPFSLISPIMNQDVIDIENYNKDTQLLYLAKRIMLKNTMYQKTPLSTLITDEQLAEFEFDNNFVDSAMTYCNSERLSILAILNPGS